MIMGTIKRTLCSLTRLLTIVFHAIPLQLTNCQRMSVIIIIIIIIIIMIITIIIITTTIFLFMSVPVLLL
jgi:hypothetical protein